MNRREGTCEYVGCRGHNESSRNRRRQPEVREGGHASRDCPIGTRLVPEDPAQALLIAGHDDAVPGPSGRLSLHPSVLSS